MDSLWVEGQAKVPSWMCFWWINWIIWPLYGASSVQGPHNVMQLVAFLVFPPLSVRQPEAAAYKKGKSSDNADQLCLYWQHRWAAGRGTTDGMGRIAFLLCFLLERKTGMTGIFPWHNNIHDILQLRKRPCRVVFVSRFFLYPFCPPVLSWLKAKGRMRVFIFVSIRCPSQIQALKGPFVSFCDTIKFSGFAFKKAFGLYMRQILSTLKPGSPSSLTEMAGMLSGGFGTPGVPSNLGEKL